MNVVVEMQVPSDALGPASVLTEGGGTRVEFDRVVPNGEGLAPYVWVDAEDFEAFESRLRDAAEVERLDRLNGDQSERLYRIAWASSDSETASEGDGAETEDVFACLAAVDAAIAHIEGEFGSLTFHVRFPDEGSVSTFASRCVEHGISIEPLRISRDGTRKRTASDLTDQQREALVVAARRGYFEVPRQATLSDIAEELAVSDHAVSERLRRGLRRLVDGAVTPEAADEGVVD